MKVSTVSCCCWGRCSFPVAHRDSERALSEEFGRSTSGICSDERDSNIHNRGEHEDQGPGVQQPSETAVEYTSGGGQDDGDGHDLVQSGRSKGESQHSDCTIVHIDRYYQSRRGAGSTGLLGVLWL